MQLLPEIGLNEGPEDKQRANNDSVETMFDPRCGAVQFPGGGGPVSISFVGPTR